MRLETLDIVLLGVSVLLIAGSFIVNVISTLRLGRLSENLNLLEKNWESKEAVKGREGSAASAKPAYEAAILSAVDGSPSDSRTGLRYRPPGSRTMKLKTAAAPGAAELPPQPKAPAVPKSGARVATSELPASEAPHAPLHFSEEAFVSGPSVKQVEHPITPLPTAPPEVTSELLPTETQELLKKYLGNSSPLLSDTKTASPLPLRSVPVEERGKSEPNTEMISFDGIFAGTEIFKDDREEVLEVVGEGVSNSPSAAESPASMEINPFDPSRQKVNFHLIQSLLRQLDPGKEFLLDFQDILFLLENEWTAFAEIVKESAEKKVRLSLKNVAGDIKADISARSIVVNLV